MPDCRKPIHRMLRILRPCAVPIFLSIVVLLSGCATAPVGHEHVPSYALKESDRTFLARLVSPGEQSDPGLSGFELVSSGREAYEARYALALRAERTLDVQYFVWENDASGRLLLAALIDAARRGVRVRILLDDLYLAGRDSQLAAIDGYPNIEVRLFNPFRSRWAHLPDFLFDFARVNHRMHDKAFIADNAVAIVGGRNVGDAYFSASGEGANFRDLDLFAAGPIVRAVSANFDEFWNSPWATSIHRLDSEPTRPRDLRAVAEDLRRPLPKNPKFPFEADLTPPSLDRLLVALPNRLTWAEARLLADDPDKTETSDPKVARSVQKKLDWSVSREALIESAYFIPAGYRLQHLCSLTARGVHVRVLTNSLASNDEVSAYAGYKKYRKDLLRCGVELHELRADAGFVEQEWTWLDTHSAAMLHSKATVLDRRDVLIGSFNMDPRSATINTEMVLFIRSPDLAAKVAALIERDMSLDNSWWIRLRPDGDIVWIGRKNGQIAEYHDAPNAAFWRRVQAKVLSLLPIDSLL